MVDAGSAKQRLLDAAGRIFSERGYEAATVRDICAQADANLAAVNYHFGDKERLYIEAVKWAHAQKLAKAPPTPPPPGATPQQRLRHFIRTMLERMVFDHEEPSWCTQLVMRELAMPTSACRELTQEFIRPQFEQLVALIADLAPPRTPARQLHLMGFSIVGQCLHQRLARPIIGHLVGPEEHASYDLDRLTDHITSFSLNGIAGLALRREAARQAASGGKRL